MDNISNKIIFVKKWNLLSLSIVAFAITFAILLSLSYIDSAHALTKYENCIINASNNHGKLLISEVTSCYDNEFKGAKASDADGHPL